MTDLEQLVNIGPKLAADLRDSGTLAATVTAGQAFGGDHEAVNVASALAVAAGVARADLIVKVKKAKSRG